MVKNWQAAAYHAFQHEELKDHTMEAIRVTEYPSDFISLILIFDDADHWGYHESCCLTMQFIVLSMNEHYFDLHEALAITGPQNRFQPKFATCNQVYINYKSSITPPCRTLFWCVRNYLNPQETYCQN